MFLWRLAQFRCENLEGVTYTRQPALGTGDAEDDDAWYRLREDGAVSVYNQDVLVRHDPGRPSQ